LLQNERLNDFGDVLRIAMDGYAANQWHAMPGIVESYNATRGTVSVQPSIQAIISNLSGPSVSTSNVNLPVLLDVPVVYMGGGLFVTTFPIQVGDEALVVFADRCIDRWWAKGGIQKQAEIRLHDLSDGFAFIGPRSLARSIPNVSSTAVQIRSLDGTTVIELGPGEVKITAPTVTVNATAATVMATGLATVTGAQVAITATEGVAINGAGLSMVDGFNFASHTHSGGTLPHGVTGPMVPGT
jgi:hypothetical protein